MAKHMGIDERKRIELLLGLRWTAAEIAREMGRRESTISREILARRVSSNKGYGCSNRLCAKFDECRRTRIWSAAQNTKLHKHLGRCFECCDEFRERACLKLGSSPYVCNGCEQLQACPLAKKLYVASAAQANYGSVLSESRRGVAAKDGRIAEMNRVLAPCILRGQSIRHVMASNPDVFRGIGERSVYRYVEERLFDVTRGDLPAAYKRRPQKKQAETRSRAKQRIGRTYREFCEFRDANDGVKPVELDTVLGTMGGKVLFTLMFPSKLMLAFLKDAKTPQTCTRVFNQIWEAAGARLFRRMFPVVLTDNGTEFADPEGIEFARVDPVHNPYKLVRRTRVFFCDAYRASQKPHVERNHEELRRILTKGVSFDSLTQEQVNLALSHVNSYTRGVLGNGTPYDEFVKEFGEEGKAFLGKLGVVRIPANEVTLSPALLGSKFRRIANKAVMKKHGAK